MNITSRKEKEKIDKTKKSGDLQINRGGDPNIPHRKKTTLKDHFFRIIKKKSQNFMEMHLYKLIPTHHQEKTKKKASDKKWG